MLKSSFHKTCPWLLALVFVVVLPAPGVEAQEAVKAPTEAIVLRVLVQSDKGVRLSYVSPVRKGFVRLAMQKAPSPSYCDSHKGERWCVTRAGKCRCYDMAALHNQIVRWNRRFAKFNAKVFELRLSAEPDVPLRAVSAMLEAARCHRGLAARDGTIRAPGKGFKTLKDYRRSVPIPNPNPKPSARSGCQALVVPWMNATMRRVPAAVAKSKNKSSGNTLSPGELARLMDAIQGPDGERYTVGMSRDEAIILKVPKGGNIGGIIGSKPEKPSNTAGQVRPPPPPPRKGKRFGNVKFKTRVLVARVTVGAVQVTGGGLTAPVIRKAINRQKGGVIDCYKKAVQSQPDLKGKVIVKLTISPTGKVLRPGIQKSTLGSARVEQCIVSQLRQWHFPAPQNGGVVAVSYPIVFRTR